MDKDTWVASFFQELLLRGEPLVSLPNGWVASNFNKLFHAVSSYEKLKEQFNIYLYIYIL